MGVSINGGFPQQTMGFSMVFLLKMIILGCEMGVPPFKETPIYEMNIDSPPNWKLGFVFSLIKLVILLMDKNPAFSS